MYVFVGTLHNNEAVENAAVIVIFPGKIESGAPVSVHWQWAKDSQGGNSLYEFTGTITGVVPLNNNRFEVRIQPLDEFYNMISIEYDGAEMSNATIRLEDAVTGEPVGDGTLEVIFPNEATAAFSERYGCDIYKGIINYEGYMNDKIFILAIPYSGISLPPAIVFWQWNDNGPAVYVQTHASSMERTESGQRCTFRWGDNYRFTAELNQDETEAALTGIDANDNPFVPMTLTRSYRTA